MPLATTWRRSLSEMGAQILSQSGDSRDGFHFDYKLGNSFGSLKISPLAIGAPLPHRGAPLPEGTMDVNGSGYGYPDCARFFGEPFLGSLNASSH